MEVDGQQVSTSLHNPVSVRYNRDIYIGGGENLLEMEGVRSKLNFVGCIQQLTFNKVPMLKEAKSDIAGYTKQGRIEWTCSEIQ